MEKKNYKNPNFKLNDIKHYIETMMSSNKVGISAAIMEYAQRRYPQNFVTIDDEHPFDTNYNERMAYYDGICFAYQNILELLQKE